MALTRCYALQQIGSRGDHWRPFIFLAGPTPRDRMVVPSWRPEACRYLDEMLPRGTIVIPEDEGVGQYDPTKGDQVPWEWDSLDQSGSILFWVPRNMATLRVSRRTSSSVCCNSGKIILGYPPEAEHLGYLDRVAQRNHIPILNDLRTTCAFAASLAHHRRWTHD